MHCARVGNLTRKKKYFGCRRAVGVSLARMREAIHSLGEDKANVNRESRPGTEAEDWRPKAKNKCGPGQPPGPHLVLADIPLALPRAGRGQRIACISLRRVPRCDRAGQNRPAKIALRYPSATLRWLTASPAVCGGPF